MVWNSAHAHDKQLCRQCPQSHSQIYCQAQEEKGMPLSFSVSGFHFFSLGINLFMFASAKRVVQNSYNKTIYEPGHDITASAQHHIWIQDSTLVFCSNSILKKQKLSSSLSVSYNNDLTNGCQ